MRTPLSLIAIAKLFTAFSCNNAIDTKGKKVEEGKLTIKLAALSAVMVSYSK
jgi:hypothetical protein